MELISLRVFGEETRVFRDAAAARDHILDHLLTAPECEAWRLLLPEVELGEALREREWQARQLLEDASRGQALYAAYARAIGRALLDGGALGLCWRRDDRHIWMGLEGVVVVEQERRGRCVLTAFIPHELDVRAVARFGEPSTAEVPLPRDIERWTRRGGEGERARKAREARRRHSAPDVLIFVEVFRPAAQVLLTARFDRECVEGSRDEGRLRDPYLLRNPLHSSGLLRQPGWQEAWRRSRDVTE
jgi:hypothetical protein